MPTIAPPPLKTITSNAPPVLEMSLVSAAETDRLTRNSPVTRTNKHNDRDHQGLADGTADAEQHLPRYFAKSGFVDVDPKKTKKDGGGKGNWGAVGDEAIDGEYNLAHPRRRSNSSVASSKDFKTKFETIDPEPVFEEELHGARANVNGEDEESMSLDLDKHSSSDSLESVDEVHEGHKM